MGSLDVGAGIDALVFDFDGVILDTETVIHDVWREVYQRFGASFTWEEWVTSVGTHGGFEPYGSLCERTGAALPPESVLRRDVDAEIAARTRRLQPMRGIREWIGAAGRLGLRVAIASSSPVSWVDGLLGEVGLREEFSCISCRTDQLAAKPAPDVYLNACRALGVEPWRAVAVEDSLNGLVAARAAGLRCVAVPGPLTARCDFTGADLVLGSLGDVELEAAVAHLGIR